MSDKALELFVQVLQSLGNLIILRSLPPVLVQQQVSNPKLHQEEWLLVELVVAQYHHLVELLEKEDRVIQTSSQVDTGNLAQAEYVGFPHSSSLAWKLFFT
jgi:N-dimethylarginine dimethylaminohydrolase